MSALTERIAAEHLTWAIRMDVLICAGCEEPLRHRDDAPGTPDRWFARHVAEVTEAEVKTEALYDLAAHMETLPAGTRTLHDPATIRKHADRNHPRKDQQ